MLFARRSTQSCYHFFIPLQKFLETLEIAEATEIIYRCSRNTCRYQCTGPEMMARMLRAGAKCALCDSPLERANVRIIRSISVFICCYRVYCGDMQMASGQLAHTAAKTASRLNRQTKEMGISLILDRLESEKLPEYVLSIIMTTTIPTIEICHLCVKTLQ